MDLSILCHYSIVFRTSKHTNLYRCVKWRKSCFLRFSRTYISVARQVIQMTYGLKSRKKQSRTSFNSCFTHRTRISLFSPNLKMQPYNVVQNHDFGRFRQKLDFWRTPRDVTALRHLLWIHGHRHHARNAKSQKTSARHVTHAWTGPY